MTADGPKLTRQQRRKLQREGLDSVASPKIVMPMGVEALQAFGPMVECSWSLPRQREQEIISDATHPPAPMVKAWMLVDTGASRSVIDQQTASEMGLVSHGAHQIFGSQGGHAGQLFKARWSVQVSQDGTQFTKELEVTSAPTRGGFPKPVIGIIGRDILRHARLRYDGDAGEFELELDPSGFERVPLDLP